MDLLKTTLIAFFLSTSLHIGMIFSYYWLYLYYNPDDEGKKNFYSQTTVSQGVNIGGKTLGGGGVQTNHHKSYVLHLIREYYKSLSTMFFVEFSLIYVFFLYILSFFENRAQLKEDTHAAFEAYKSSSQQAPSKRVKKAIKKKSTLKLKKQKPRISETEEDVDSHNNSLELESNTMQQANTTSRSEDSDTNVTDKKLN